MEDLLSFSKSIVQVYWANDYSQYLLLISLIVILLLEKRNWVKNIYVFYSVLVLFVMINPISILVFERIWKRNVSYFCRQISLAPIVYAISYACVLVVRKFDGIKKLIAVVVSCVSVALCGTNIYYDEVIEKNDNISDISADIMTICDYIDEKNDGIVVGACHEAILYLRQYDYNIILLYERDSESAIVYGLDGENVDVEMIMSEAAKEGCDYIISTAGDDIVRVYEEKGYEPEVITAKYLLYKVSGYEGIKLTYNDKHQLTQLRYVDENDNLMMGKSGYAIKDYEYFENGFLKSEKYYDMNYSLVMTTEGMSGVLYEDYDRKGRACRTTYIGQDEKPMIHQYGYATIEREYFSDGKIKKESYFDEKGMPLCMNNGEFGREYEYDINGRVMYRNSLGPHKESIINVFGYAAVKYDRDINGNMICISYYDCDKHPINVKGDYQQADIVRAADGNVIDIRYIDVEKKECANDILGLDEIVQNGDIGIEREVGLREVIGTDWGISRNVLINGDFFCFKTRVAGNRFNNIYNQIFTENGEYIESIHSSNILGDNLFDYTHSGATGMYVINIKGNTNLADEYFSEKVFLKEGTQYYFYYNLIKIEEKCIELSDFAIYEVVE